MHATLRCMHPFFCGNSPEMAGLVNDAELLHGAFRRKNKTSAEPWSTQLAHGMPWVWPRSARRVQSQIEKSANHSTATQGQTTQTLKQAERIDFDSLRARTKEEKSRPHCYMKTQFPWPENIPASRNSMVPHPRCCTELKFLWARIPSAAPS